MTQSGQRNAMGHFCKALMIPAQFPGGSKTYCFDSIYMLIFHLYCICRTMTSFVIGYLRINQRFTTLLIIFYWSWKQISNLRAKIEIQIRNIKVLLSTEHYNTLEDLSKVTLNGCFRNKKRSSIVFFNNVW